MSLASTCSLTVVAVDASASISWAATEVTNPSPRHGASIAALRTVSTDSSTSSENSAHAGPVLCGGSVIVGLLKHPGGCRCSQDAETNFFTRMLNASGNAETFATPARVTIVPSSRDRLAPSASACRETQVWRQHLRN